MAYIVYTYAYSSRVHGLLLVLLFLGLVAWASFTASSASSRMDSQSYSQVALEFQN